MAQVTGVDTAENLIDHARIAAVVARQDAQFDVADSENLPYADGSFNAATTLIGTIFAPRPVKVVAESDPAVSSWKSPWYGAICRR